MQSNPRTLAPAWPLLAIACLLLCAFSLTFLGTRNLYEDEVNSFLLIPQPVAAIWTMANSTDVHPPGMYVLSHFFYSWTQSERWAAAGSLAFLIVGLLVFAHAALQSLEPRHQATAGLFCALAFLHPHLLMWAATVRWYPYWTGLALIVLTCGLRLGKYESAGRAAAPSLPLAAGLGLAAGVMVYINYLTLPFLAAFAAAYLVRFGLAWRPFLSLCTLLATAALIGAPQAGVLLRVHLTNGGSQSAPLFVAAARLVHGIIFSEALLPWNAAGILFTLLGAPLCGYGISSALMRRFQPRQGSDAAAALALFFVCMLAFGVLTQTGAKPRNFILLCPIFAYLAAYGYGELPWPAWHSHTARAAALLLPAFWITSGAAHLLTKTGTAKGGLNDRPEQVVQLLQTVGQGHCVVIFTHEAPLTYVLNRAAAGHPWDVVSAFPDYVHHLPAASRRQSCTPDFELVVQSYTGALHDFKPSRDHALALATALIATPRTAHLSIDPDFQWKARLPGFREGVAGESPARFIVTYGPVKPDADWQRAATAFAFYQPPEWDGVPSRFQADLGRHAEP
jgi:hypothetical protein